MSGGYPSLAHGLGQVHLSRRGPSLPHLHTLLQETRSGDVRKSLCIHRWVWPPRQRRAQHRPQPWAVSKSPRPQVQAEPWKRSPAVKESPRQTPKSPPPGRPPEYPTSIKPTSWQITKAGQHFGVKQAFLPRVCFHFWQPFDSSWISNANARRGHLKRLWCKIPHVPNDRTGSYILNPYYSAAVRFLRTVLGERQLKRTSIFLWPCWPSQLESAGNHFWHWKG